MQTGQGLNEKLRNCVSKESRRASKNPRCTGMAITIAILQSNVIGDTNIWKPSQLGKLVATAMAAATYCNCGTRTGGVGCFALLISRCHINLFSLHQVHFPSPLGNSAQCLITRQQFQIGFLFIFPFKNLAEESPKGCFLTYVLENKQGEYSNSW